MIRTMVYLDEGIHHWLRSKAVRTGQTVAALVREALKAYQKGKEESGGVHPLRIACLGKSPRNRISEAPHEAFRSAVLKKGFR